MPNYNLASLANAAYADFSDETKISESLQNKGLPKKQAEEFNENYEIKAHQSNTTSGYSGTIVRSKITGEYFVLHRGTEIKANDIATYAILVATGIPYGQIDDAKRFVDDAIKKVI